ncbi:MAG: hypothetical protein SNH88_07790 [Rikenellaceae bacterium]
MSSLTFGAAEVNAENYIGSTNGVVMDMSAINAKYGYGLVQIQAGRNIRFYNLHGIGGLTLRLETGLESMNRAQFGGVWDIIGENISVVNGQSAVMCVPHGMKNGVCHFDGITAISSGLGFGLGESDANEDPNKGHNAGYAGSFGAGTSVKNVTAVFGTNAQIKLKSLGSVPWELRDEVGEPYDGVINNAPSLGCVRIATRVPIVYDIDTFHAIGFEYGEPISI